MSLQDRTFFNTCVQPNLFIQNISGVTYETHVYSELFQHMLQKDTEAALNNVNRLKPLVTEKRRTSLPFGYREVRKAVKVTVTVSLEEKSSPSCREAWWE